MATLAQIERYRELLKYKWLCDDVYCDGLPHEGMPHKHARHNQRFDPTGPYIQAWITGRGFGKTRGGAEITKGRMLAEPGHRVCVVAPTFGVGRDVCVEGESGVLSIIPEEYIANWNRSLGELILKNKSMLKIFGAHSTGDAESIRGYQSHTVWGEEFATWRHDILAFDMALMTNRLGDDPRIIMTGTPKNTPLVKRILAYETKGKAKITRGSTFDNANNLAATFIEHLTDTYANTRLGLQELEGQLLEDVQGALWTRDLIRAADEAPGGLTRVVVGVDPSGGHRQGVNDQTGIVAVGRTEDGLCYVLADRSGHYTPEEWARQAIELYDEVQADCIVAERNFGGAMVESTLRTYSDRPKFKLVTATRGKIIRAEPVVNLYERKRVVHVGLLADLEDQMCGWIPPGATETDSDGVTIPIPPSGYSPDRIDALVWAITDLVLQPKRARTMMTSVLAGRS